MTRGDILRWTDKGDGNFEAVATVQGKVAVFQISQQSPENLSVRMVFPLGLVAGADSLEHAKEMAQGFLDALGGGAGEPIDFKD